MTRGSRFAPLALTTALLTVGLVVFGAVVRVTDSGLGCGNSWPLCNGTIFPPLDNLTAWIEWMHRLFALLIGVFGLIMLAVALRAYRQKNRTVLVATVVGAGLFLAQSMLGALVVVMDLPPTFVTLHLGTAMLLLGALLVAAVAASYRPRITEHGGTVLWMAGITTALSFVIILTGALVRGSGATLACLEWPLCFGQVLPLQEGQLAVIHMFHRFAVLALGITLVLLLWYVLRSGRDRAARLLSAAAFVLYLAQAAAGAALVLTSAPPLWGALHVGLAASTWGCLVVLCTLEVLNARTQSEKAEWPPQSDPLKV